MRLFLVQEYVSGMNLSEHLARKGRWSYEEGREALAALLPALEHIHERVPPLIHRDIKPSNVIEDDSGELFLIDFGAVQEQALTTVGGSTVIGTPGYMPAEQMIGRAQPSSDLYSLGVTLCHMITGVSPVEVALDDQNKLDYASLLSSSEPLTPLLLRMIEPTRSRRFESARDTLAALSGASSRALSEEDVRGRARALSAWDAWARGALDGYNSFEVFEGVGDGVHVPLESVKEDIKEDVEHALSLGWVYEGSFETWAAESNYWALSPFIVSTNFALMRSSEGSTWSNGRGMLFTFFEDGTGVVTGAVPNEEQKDMVSEAFEHHKMSGPLEALTSEHERHVARRVHEGARALYARSPQRVHRWMLAAIDPPLSKAQATTQTVLMLIFWTMLFFLFIPLLWWNGRYRKRLTRRADVRAFDSVERAFGPIRALGDEARADGSTGVALDFGDGDATHDARTHEHSENASN